MMDLFCGRDKHFPNKTNCNKGHYQRIAINQLQAWRCVDNIPSLILGRDQERALCIIRSRRDQGFGQVTSSCRFHYTSASNVEEYLQGLPQRQAAIILLRVIHTAVCWDPHNINFCSTKPLLLVLIQTDTAESLFNCPPGTAIGEQSF